MKDRRASPRTPCRLHCRFRRDRDRIRGRVIDVSEGGLCVLSPIELEKGQRLNLELEVPGYGHSLVETEVWHLRVGKNRSTGRRTWSVGLVLRKGDSVFTHLVDGSGAEEPPAIETDDIASDETNTMRIFRVRVKQKGHSRTRLLTFTASNEAEATQLATMDLGRGWSVIEVAEKPR